MLFRLLFPANSIALSNYPKVKGKELTYMAEGETEPRHVVAIEVRTAEGGNLPLEWITHALCIYELRRLDPHRPVKFDLHKCGDVTVESIRDLLFNVMLEPNEQTPITLPVAQEVEKLVLMAFAGPIMLGKAIQYMKLDTEDLGKLHGRTKRFKLPYYDQGEDRELELTLLLVKTKRTHVLNVPLSLRQYAAVVWDVQDRKLDGLAYKIAPMCAALGYSDAMMGELLEPHLAEMSVYDGALYRSFS